MIVWDEISMSHWNVYEAVDHSLQDIRNNGRPFGGMTVVFGGDFQQTLPIIPRGSQEQVVCACLTHSRLFHHIKVFYLTQNMRCRRDSTLHPTLPFLHDFILRKPYQKMYHR